MRPPFLPVLALVSCPGSRPGTGPDAGPGGSPEVVPALRPVLTPGSIAFVHAAVLEPSTGVLEQDRTVLVSGDRIAAVGPDGALGVPAEARTVDVAVRTLLPGLVDSHPRATAEAGTWNCPTLTVVKVLNQDAPTASEAFARRRLLVGALHAAGARLLAGTDSGIDATEPGTSLHDELDELVASGLSPLDALRAATTRPAEFLGRVGEVGTALPGARADLVLVDGDPRQDVSVLRHPRGVLLRGAWLERPCPGVTRARAWRARPVHRRGPQGQAARWPARPLRRCPPPGGSVAARSQPGG